VPGVAAAVVAAVVAAALVLPAPAPCDGCAAFGPATRPWQIQLQGPANTKLDAHAFEVDGFDATKRTVRRIERGRRRSICYLDAGSWESFRPDRDTFAPELLGNVYAGFEDERWLDIRRVDLLQPILEARIEMCRDKGFDAVDPDNVNGYENDTGFPLTASDQLRFNTFLANLVHAHGMAVALKNDGPQAATLARYFDFAVVEECFAQRDCRAYRAFVKAGKAAYAIEYAQRSARVCRDARRWRFSVIFKHMSLRSYRRTC
jgi:hypothetical protein